jgi:hypothetical protein
VLPGRQGYERGLVGVATFRLRYGGDTSISRCLKHHLRCRTYRRVNINNIVIPLYLDSGSPQNFRPHKEHTKCAIYCLVVSLALHIAVHSQPELVSRSPSVCAVNSGAVMHPQVYQIHTRLGRSRRPQVPPHPIPPVYVEAIDGRGLGIVGLEEIKESWVLPTYSSSLLPIVGYRNDLLNIGV